MFFYIFAFALIMLDLSVRLMNEWSHERSASPILFQYNKMCIPVDKYKAGSQSKTMGISFNSADRQPATSLLCLDPLGQRLKESFVIFGNLHRR